MTSISLEEAANRMRCAQSAIGEAMEDPAVWDNEGDNVTASVREAAQLLGLEPGKLAGYMEVWSRVASVQMHAKRLARLQALADKGYTTR